MAPKVLSLAVAAVFAALPAFAAEMMPAPMHTAMGEVMADGHGMTLYTFDKDSMDKSACTDACTHNWPPLMAPAGAMAHDSWTLVAREGGMQWAYKGHLLYTWSKDAKPGDTTGDGFKGLWHVARP